MRSVAKTRAYTSELKSRDGRISKFGSLHGTKCLSHEDYVKNVPADTLHLDP